MPQGSVPDLLVGNPFRGGKGAATTPGTTSIVSAPNHCAAVRALTTISLAFSCTFGSLADSGYFQKAQWLDS